MYPYVINNSSFQLQTYFVLIFVGLVLALVLFRKLTSKDNIDNASYNFYSTLALVSIGVGFMSAIFFQSIYNVCAGLSFFDKNEGGMTFMGGLIGGAVTFIVGTWIFGRPYIKHDFWKVVNIAAACTVVAHCFGRIGCFFAGCCYGKPTDSIFGIMFPADSESSIMYPGQKVFPTQLYEALFLFILFIILINYRKIALIIYLYAYAVFRFFIEFLRGDYRGDFLIPGITPSQFQSILMLLVAVALTLYVYKFKRVPFQPKEKGEQD